MVVRKTASLCPEPPPLERGLDPRVDANTRVLLLGSFPGRASLDAGHYYAHPRNAFWPIMADLTSQPDLIDQPFETRYRALNAAGVGLWDLYTQARRRGSLDAAIRDAQVADLKHLLTRRLPQLRAIAFNGRTAARGRRVVLALGRELQLIDLPSTSPAHAVLSRDEKIAQWRAALLPVLHDSAVPPRGTR
ncbi:MAG: DNA-deoxyinosine glycosylase [Thioalkalivibrionaceae bacterium]